MSSVVLARPEVRGGSRVGLGGFGHRPALDGLRTVAVYLVVLFHAGVEAFHGGFVGVDVFFVLSGFLVVNVLLTELDRHGHIRMWRFYARRVRRLLPAASAAIVGTVLLMLVVADHVDRLGVVGDARAASLWFANWHFLVESTSYFAEGARVSPFLHFWSLAIEEQFYLAFPLVMLAAWRWLRDRPDRMWMVLLGGTVAGLVTQAWLARHNPDAAYYATHARVYQLLAGATVGAWVRVRGVPAVARRYGAVASGCALAALVLVGSQWFPVAVSWRGIAATATSVVLLVALEGAQQGRVAGLLGREPTAYLGRISYGTYLWHWPLLVAAQRVLELGAGPALLVSGVGGTALAAASHAWLERPVRQAPRLDRWPRFAVAGGVVVALATGAVAAPVLLDSPRHPMVNAVAESAGHPGYADGRDPVPAGIDAAALRTDRSMGPHECFTSVEACVVVPGDGLSVHVTGDSHAGMLLPAFEALARRNGWRLSATTINACPWIPDLFTGDPGDPRAAACGRRRTQAYEETIPALQPDVVVAMMAPRGRDHDGKGVFSTRPELSGATPFQLLQALTLPGVRRLAGLAPRLVVLETVPRAEEDMLACLTAARQLGQCAFEAPPASQVVDDQQVRAAVARVDGATSVDLDRLACPRLPLCTPVEDGLVVRRDAHHLSGEFVRGNATDLGRLLAGSGAFDEAGEAAR